MAVPQDKEELLKAIDTNFDKLLKELDSIPEHLTAALDLEGHAKGTQMSVRNLVSYLIGWNELVLKWLDRDAAGLSIDFPETGFKWNELGLLAQKFYLDYDGIAYSELLGRLRTAKDRIVSIVEAKHNEALYGRPWYEKWTMGRMIQFNTASPYDNARGRLRRWSKANNLPGKSHL
ncbi:ClbS/DfsB family four-helix bundle protein [Rhizobium sp. KVB221]|uniref:ClbS/DfsB family four-helix bundle protein n=1 Tax=Rhizobium setariae TaxID=2801340 RepID=A0A936YQL7_9HYPH|nr:ClbS/DfsB family four-helix bundle protein [Rhizobium setariae]MBL0372731.1 ClbS/DfsB family four-helix bundle protein [Rhizobium setariae]